MKGKRHSNESKTGNGIGNTAATRKPGKTGATGIIKRTDTGERPVRTGKTGPTGIIRETGKNGMEAPGGAANAFEEPDGGGHAGGNAAGAGHSGKGRRGSKAAFAKSGPPAPVKAKGGKHLPVILVTNDDGISAPGIRNLVE